MAEDTFRNMVGDAGVKEASNKMVKMYGRFS
jgi:hypothetical protein